MRCNRKLVLAAAAAVVGLIAWDVKAASFAWSGQGIDGDWSTLANWGLFTFSTPQADDEADFHNGTSRSVSNIDTNRSVGTLNINGAASTGDYVFTGANTTLTANVFSIGSGGACFPTVSTGLTINATEMDVAPTCLLTISGGGSVSTPSLHMNFAGTNAAVSIGNQGTLTLSGTAAVSDGTLILGTGGTLKMSSGAVLNANTSNGFVELDQAWSLPSGATVTVTAAGRMTAVNNFDVATSGAGTLVVDGVNSSLSVGGSGAAFSTWAAPGGSGTIQISNSGVANYKSGLRIATAGGTANVNIKTGGKLIVTNGLFVGGSANAATVTLNNGTLQIAAGTTAFASFGSGSKFNFQSGTLQLAGDATFNAGSALNWSGGTISATGRTLGISAGAATFTWGGIDIINNTISVTNGGSLNVGSVSASPSTGAGTITLNNGTLNILGPAKFVSGTTVSASNLAAFNLGDNSTFATGSSINLNNVFFSLASGKTLTVDGGAVTDTRNALLGANETMVIQNGGHWDAIQEDLEGGTLTVTGTGSRFTSSSATLASVWGGPDLNVTFENHGIGTFAGRVIFGGGTFENQLNVATFSAATFGSLTAGGNTSVGGVNGATTISIDRTSTLTVTGTAQFSNGAVVNEMGVLTLDGNATFSAGSTFNPSGLYSFNTANQTTLAFDGGVGTFPAALALGSGNTLRVTNGGKVTANTELDIANGVATGTLLVDSGSTFSSNNVIFRSQWGMNAGNSATVTFSHNAVGTFTPGIFISTNGGQSTVNITSGAKLTAGDLTVGGVVGSSALLTVDGGTLNVTSDAEFDAGTTVNYAAGSISVGGTLGVGIAGNAQVLLTPGANKVLRAGGVDIRNASKIDLADNDMIVGALTTTERGRSLHSHRPQWRHLERHARHHQFHGEEQRQAQHDPWCAQRRRVHVCRRRRNVLRSALLGNRHVDQVHLLRRHGLQRRRELRRLLAAPTPDSICTRPAGSTVISTSTATSTSMITR